VTHVGPVAACKTIHDTLLAIFLLLDEMSASKNAQRAVEVDFDILELWNYQSTRPNCHSTYLLTVQWFSSFYFSIL